MICLFYYSLLRVVVAAKIIGSHKQGDSYRHKVNAVHHFRYRGAINPHFIPVPSNQPPTSRHAASIEHAPDSFEVVSKCQLKTGQTYFMSGSNGSTSTNLLELSPCCMAYPYKTALYRYNRRCQLRSSH
jgi:hypothetical protein